MSRNVLLVALDPVPEDEVRKAIAERNEGADVNVHVVAPATHMGTFKWLTGEEDDARAEAAELADRTAEAVDAEVDTEVGERDPLLAVEDALALFPADEILVVAAPIVRHAEEQMGHAPVHVQGCQRLDQLIGKTHARR